MFQRFSVISFFTEGTGYEAEAERLVRSLDAHGIEHDVAPLPSLGTWTANCAMKAAFIESMLIKHERPVVWLDADAEVVAPLDLFEDTPCEFGVRRRDNVTLSPRWGPWQSGTLYFAYCDRALALVREWKDYGAAHPDLIDQVTLHKAWEGMDDPPDTLFLPWSYCTIFDERGRPENPHVVHHQASRRLRRTVSPRM